MIPNAWAGFDFGLGTDVDMLRKSVKDFAQDRIAPRADAIDRDNVFPRDLWPEMGALGTVSATVSRNALASGSSCEAACPFVPLRHAAMTSTFSTTNNNTDDFIDDPSWRGTALRDPRASCQDWMQCSPYAMKRSGVSLKFVRPRRIR